MEDELAAYGASQASGSGGAPAHGTSKSTGTAASGKQNGKHGNGFHEKISSRVLPPPGPKGKPGRPKGVKNKRGSKSTTKKGGKGASMTAEQQAEKDKEEESIFNSLGLSPELSGYVGIVVIWFGWIGLRLYY